MNGDKKARTAGKVYTLTVITLSGIVVALLFTLLVFGFNSVALIKSLILGAFISLASGYFELFIFPKSLRKLPFVSTLLLKTLFYVMIISLPAIILWLVHESMVNETGMMDTMMGNDFRHFIFEGDFPVILVFSLAAGFLLNLFAQLSSLIGKKVFVNYLTGRYHKPLQEVRTFMFLDLTSSTAIAEKLDPVAYHKFMNRFFYDIDGPIVESKGEIYQYAGDEVIVSWKGDRGFEGNNCTECFFRAMEKINSLESDYLAEFGVSPKFRAGVHTGVVVTGEIGDSKREIVFHGDVLNTASRIQGKSKELGRDIVVSKDVIDKLREPGRYELEPLGNFELKGKVTEVFLYSVILKRE